MAPQCERWNMCPAVVWMAPGSATVKELLLLRLLFYPHRRLFVSSDNGHRSIVGWFFRRAITNPFEKALLLLLPLPPLHLLCLCLPRAHITRRETERNSAESLSLLYYTRRTHSILRFPFSLYFPHLRSSRRGT